MPKITRSKRSNTKNLLLLLPYIDLGGGARRVQVYCSYLRDYGWNVSVALYSNQVKRDVTSILGKDTQYIISSSQNEILRFAKKMSIDAMYVIFDGQFDPYLAKIFMLFKKALIKIVVNNVFSYYDKRMFDLSDRILFQTYYMGLVKFARALPLELTLPLTKMSYLTNPVHEEYLKNFHISPLQREQKRRQLGFSPETCVIGRFGRPDIVKWGDQLIGAIFQLRNDQNIAFLLVGVPRSRRYLISFLQFLFPHLSETVTILPSTSDDRELMSLIQVCDVVGHSVNIGEGCSNAINECLFWKKPVITTLTPHCDNGQSEQIIHGKTGFFAQDVSQWVRYIRLLAAKPNLRLEMGENAKKSVLKRANGPLISENFANILNDVVGNTNFEVFTEEQYLSYTKRYVSLLGEHTIYKQSDIWYKLVRNIRRVLNFLEHSYWHE